MNPTEKTPEERDAAVARAQAEKDRHNPAAKTRQEVHRDVASRISHGRGGKLARKAARAHAVRLVKLAVARQRRAR